MMHRDIPIALWAILLCGCHAEEGDMKHSIGESHPIETNAEEEKTDASASDENKPRETPKAATSQKGKPSREAVAGPPERISAHLPNLPPENRCFTVDDLPKLPEPSSLSNISQTDSTRRHHSKVHKADNKSKHRLPKHRKIVGYEDGRKKYITRHFSFSGRDRYKITVRCKLDISGNEICEVVSKEKFPYLENLNSLYQYMTLESLHKPKEILSLSKLDVDQNYYKSQILEESRYQCDQKILTINAIPREMQLDLSKLCYEAGNHITCDGERKTEAEAQDKNRLFHFDFHGLLRDANIDKMHDIREQNRDILEGSNDYYIMRACNFEEFLKRSGKDIYITNHSLYIDFDTFSKCKQPLEYQVIADTTYTLFIPGVYGYMIIDNIEDLNMLAYYNFNTLDEKIVQMVDFNKYVLLYLSGGYGKNSKIEILEACTDAPIIAYMANDVKQNNRYIMSADSERSSHAHFSLVQVPRGEYRVQLVNNSKEVCYQVRR